MRLEFDPHSLEDLKYWVKADKKKALKILKLFDEVMRTPFEGTGKPEPLASEKSPPYVRSGLVVMITFVSSAKTFGTITPIMATATTAIRNEDFNINIIIKYSQYL